MTYKAADFIAGIEAYRTNPVSIQRVQLEALEAAKDGTIDVVDATNPMVFLLEANACGAAAAMNRMEVVTRRLYPSLAVTEDDIYRHMTNVDYLGRFSLPSKAPLIFAIAWDDLRNLVVPYGDAGVRKLVIPRNTTIKVGNFTFGMQYPIEIRLMPHGNYQVVYTSELPSPLWSLTSNIVQWRKVKMPNGEWWMMIDVDFYQFTLTSVSYSLNSTAKFEKTFTLEDNFYYCRVYGLNSDGKTWNEYLTTHSDQVYDAKNPTAKLKVLGDKLVVSMPSIYFNTGQLGASLRIDIFTTKGPININLSDYDMTSYSVKFADLDATDNGVYTSPLSKLRYGVYSTGRAIGGSDPLPFSTLRERVIMNNTYVKTPITGAQLETSQKYQGFSIIKAKDIITSRTYAASKTMPVPSSGSLKAGAGTVMSMLETSIDDLITRSTVIDNGTSVTITPDTLFMLTSGVLSVLDETTYSTLTTLASNKYFDELLATMNKLPGELVYTPFHYVLDTSNKTFDLRAYYLESPVLKYRNFVAENATSQLLIGTKDVFISRIPTGYKLTVTTESGASYKALKDSQCHVQLCYLPTGESDYAYMNGTMIGEVDGERVWEFIIPTNYYLNAQDAITFTGFSMYNGETGKYVSNLTQRFFLIWEVSDYTDVNDIVDTDIDLLVNRDLVPANTLGVVQESLTLSFGTALTWLWKKARTVKDSVIYETYDQDVLAVWEETEYVMDSVTGQRKMVLNTVTGKLELVILHKKGDPKLDAEGNQVIAHYKGDVKTLNGEPIEAGPRLTVRHIDLFMIDGRFYFASEANDVAYRSEMATAVVGYLDEISGINQELLENTELYFTPITTLGNATVLIGAGLEAVISSTQSFTVQLYLSSTNYNNENLKASLLDKVQSIIHDSLVPATFSVDGLGSLIGATLGDDVMAVYVNPIGSGKDMTVFTAMDEVTRCSVKRKLVVLPDEVLQVQDDIEVQFVRHQRTVNTTNSI